ncbi:hypothetical protein ACFC1R_08810 [Kitasatospora sp. NPDC056138]|uniref:hypothetical protein n=1 Tax=Kitasatospora sp. NPDC056138 TaxID=3345724 RepID=UPI0035D865E0
MEEFDAVADRRPIPEGIGELLGLGRALRDAQARLDDARMRELTAQRHRLVIGLIATARAAAAVAGHRAGDRALAELEQTLLTALTGGSAGLALTAGQLSSALEASVTGTLASLPLPSPPTPRAAAGASAPAVRADASTRKACRTHEATDREPRFAARGMTVMPSGHGLPMIAGADGHRETPPLSLGLSCEPRQRGDGGHYGFGSPGNRRRTP